MDYKAIVLELLDLPPAASRNDILARLRILQNDLTGEWVDAGTGEEFFEKEALTSLGKRLREKAASDQLIRAMSAEISRLEEMVARIAREREPLQQKQIREALGISLETWQKHQEEEENHHVSVPVRAMSANLPGEIGKVVASPGVPQGSPPTLFVVVMEDASGVPVARTVNAFRESPPTSFMMGKLRGLFHRQEGTTFFYRQTESNHPIEIIDLPINKMSAERPRFTGIGESPDQKQIREALGISLETWIRQADY